MPQISLYDVYSTLGNVFTSAAQAAKSVDHTGEVIGHGANHLLSTSHLEQRKAHFDHTHSQYLKFLPSEPKATIVYVGCYCCDLIKVSVLQSHFNNFICVYVYVGIIY